MLLNRETDKIIAQNDINISGFKKYLVISEHDEEWGFVINDVGYTEIAPNTIYPPKGHPGTHMFSWETGRILNDYNFVLISNGEGKFESRSAGKINIKPGDGFFLFPGEWHRYKPLNNTGWTEHWVGFSGNLIASIMKNSFFDKNRPIVRDCANQLVLKLFGQLLQLTKNEPFGYQRSASGICFQMLAEICNIQQGYRYKSQDRSSISKAIFIMNERIDLDIDLERLSKTLGMSYSKFRSDFKKHTGFSPLQYFLLLKIEKAKRKLVDSNLTVKQIAFETGFESVYYFCRLFKQKMNLTPKQFRQKEWQKKVDK